MINLHLLPPTHLVFVGVAVNTPTDAIFCDLILKMLAEVSVGVGAAIFLSRVLCTPLQRRKELR